MKSVGFEELLTQRINRKLFTFANGYQPPSLNGTFKRLMRETGLLKDGAGQNRTLYSLRHTYATFELLRNGTDIHTLSKQMGNSAAMIERHFSKLTATMAEEKLAQLRGLLFELICVIFSILYVFYFKKGSK